MDYKFAGRIVGALVLVQLVAGILVNAVLTAPLFAEGGYLVNAAAVGAQLGISVLVSLVGALLALAIAVIAGPVLRDHSPAAATVFLSLTILGMGLAAVEQSGILLMRSLSEAFVAGDDAQQALLSSMGIMGSALRNGIHFVSLMVSGAALGVWYYCLLRFSLLPWPLAALGLIAVCLQLFAISQPILGGVVPFILLGPLALAQLLQSGWLLAFGFRQDAAASD